MERWIVRGRRWVQPCFFLNNFDVNFFQVSQDLNPQPPDKKEKKVCVKGGIGREVHHTPEL